MTAGCLYDRHRADDRSILYRSGTETAPQGLKNKALCRRGQMADICPTFVHTPERRPDCGQIRMATLSCCFWLFSKKIPPTQQPAKMMKVLEAGSRRRGQSPAFALTLGRTEKSSFYRAVKKPEPLYSPRPQWYTPFYGIVGLKQFI